MSQINGVIVPSIIFFDENSKIDIQLTSFLFQHQFLNGANAILIFNMEEYFADNIDQQIKLIKEAYKVTDDKIPVIFAVSGSKLEDIIDKIEDLGRKFNKLNFIIAPQFSEKRKSSELKSYFENILSSLTLNNPIFLYNNPVQFAGNEITPEVLSNLVEFPNLKGIIDASDKISFYKANINLLNEDFSVLCSNPAKFSTFLQLIPKNKRKSSGIVSSIGNLVNLCAKLFKAALEDNILEIIQIQEILDDIRDKIYYKSEKGQRFLGLKYAFLYLYRDLLSIELDNFQIDLDKTRKDVIEATVHYLINQKHIYQLFSINKEEIYRLDEIINLFSDIPILNEQGKIKKIKGPLHGTFNTNYRVNFEDSQYIFRFRTSESFPYENIAKEKLLFPFLGDLNPSFFKKIDEIIKSGTGSYIFNKHKPPKVPIGNLIYYDETKQKIPYIFTIIDYIHGKPMNQIIEQYLEENHSITTTKFLNLFSNLGEILAKLHEIKFDSFYEKITDIGSKRKKTWFEIINAELESEIQEAKKSKLEYNKEINDYFRDNIALIEEETEAVVLHNDYQSQNIIVKDESGIIRINGLIDFDDWRIGVRALDFVKFNLQTLNPLGEIKLKEAFFDGYARYWNHTIDKKFEKKIEIYTLLWLLKVYNSEDTKYKPYLFEIKKILDIN
ncbi:MAG: hypothetical protein EU540_02715 [Promethearchaeota archaeon]|nr:MAG: hypothetical protein EU540_02715 [Candidatus Lokiarchaeota archaeon]